MRQRADGSRDAVIGTQHMVAPSQVSAINQQQMAVPHANSTVNQQQVAVLTRDVVYAHHPMAAVSRTEEGNVQTHSLVGSITLLPAYNELSYNEHPAM